MRKWVYFLEDNLELKGEEIKELLGGKGAGLYLLAKAGFRVPPFFIISPKASVYYLEKGKIPDGLEEEVEEGIGYLEKKTNKKFGSLENPLLLSVRSGSKFSMPGMMDTILNLGINDEICSVLAQRSGEEFAYHLYQRFLEIFSDVVLGIKREKFLSLNLEGKEAIAQYKKILRGKLPQDPFTNLFSAIVAVFKSWNNPRAIEYRRIYKIPDNLGTAVNIQAMVFGNLNDRSGTGVVFSRDPATGEKKIYGEFLLRAQGEDLVAGIRTPEPIDKLRDYLPNVYEELKREVGKIEREFRDMQDIEFTIENEVLYFLQTRSAKRSPQAKLKVVVDMLKDGLLAEEEAIMRMTEEDIISLLNPVFDPKFKYQPVTTGIPASPGCAVGEIVLSSEGAIKKAKEGVKVILVREFTKADEIAGMEKANGFLTTTGGKTSHAAVVARGMGKPCIVGANGIRIDEKRRMIYVQNPKEPKKVCKRREGEVISINGSTGEIVFAEVPLVEPEMTQELKDFLSLCDKFRKLGVWANADKPKEAARARDLGAEGIGLARTEHMFFHPDRIRYFQMMILSEDTRERKKFLAKLLPYQRKDFEGLFKAMAGLPVTIRTLDPPLHEFLPTSLNEVKKLAKKIGIKPDVIFKKIAELKEENPMMGFRGCRLGIAYPEITEMQARAIFLAACRLKKKGISVLPEIMIPLTITEEELKNQRAIIEKVAEEVFKKTKVRVEYKVGTMVETPRACLTIKTIAQYADFFSFGTNDLTQMVFGFSRDDYPRFLPYYLEKKILSSDPFITLDKNGLGRLIEMAVKEAREVRKDFKIGICGQHGGDPRSIEFCHQIGFTYVSCDTPLVPIARLAAAQARIKEEKGEVGIDLTR
ncbi:MAG: pyruvate, phosphate dikinase [candidate division WOR-3 bacterium]